MRAGEERSIPTLPEVSHDVFNLPAGDVVAPWAKDPADDPDYVAGSRRAEEQAAFQQLFERLTPAERPWFLKALDPKVHVGIASIGDPDKSRLFHTVTSIRAADRAVERRAQSRLVARQRALMIHVATVNAATLGSNRIRVIRDPSIESGCWNLILLRAGEAEPADVVAGLAMMCQMRERDGDELTEAVRADLAQYRGSLTNEQRAVATDILRRLDDQPLRRVDDLGEARVVTVRLGPVTR